MIEKINTSIIFFAHYTESGVSKTGLTVSINVYKVTRAGVSTQIVTNSACTEIGNGLYRYLLASASVDASAEYIGVFNTATTTVDVQNIPSMWVVDRAGVSNLDTTVSSRSSATALSALQSNVTTILTDYARRTGDYAPLHEYDTRMTAIQSDLDNPAQYKADVSALALESTLTAIKGAGWTDQTLAALGNILDLVRGDTGTILPALLVGLQNWIATEIEGTVASGIITQIRGNTWDIEIPGITLDPNKQQFAIKRRASDSDSDALLLVDSVIGLLVINGISTGITPGDASLSYNAVALTLHISVKANITAQLPAGIWLYGIQGVSFTGVIAEPYGGVFTVLADVVRAQS